jgi:hypothetical protein
MKVPAIDLLLSNMKDEALQPLLLFTLTNIAITVDIDKALQKDISVRLEAFHLLNKIGDTDFVVGRGVVAPIKEKKEEGTRENGSF